MLHFPSVLTSFVLGFSRYFLIGLRNIFWKVYSNALNMFQNCWLPSGKGSRQTLFIMSSSSTTLWCHFKTSLTFCGALQWAEMAKKPCGKWIYSAVLIFSGQDWEVKESCLASILVLCSSINSPEKSCFFDYIFRNDKASLVLLRSIVFPNASPENNTSELEN